MSIYTCINTALQPFAHAITNIDNINNVVECAFRAFTYKVDNRKYNQFCYVFDIRSKFGVSLPMYRLTNDGFGLTVATSKQLFYNPDNEEAFINTITECINKNLQTVAAYKKAKQNAEIDNLISETL